MTQADGPHRHDRDPIDPVHNAARPGRKGVRNGRVLVPATFLGIIIVVFGIILGVSQCAAPADDDSQGAGPVSVVSVEAPPAG